jgi:hypothetical protein
MMTLACADSAGVVAATSHPPVRDVASDYNVVWETPSTNSLGSMPLGNGDVGVNVWVEGNGDLLFYVSKVDAFDAGHALPKLGRVRLRLDPPMPVEPFRQTLVLHDGAVTIRGGDVNLRVWVDAHHPVVRVTGTSRKPVNAAVSFETLRACSEREDQADRLAWGYRNTSSVWRDRVRSQNSPEFAARVADPLLNRTSGCRLSGIGFVRDGQRTLRLRESRTLDVTVRVLSRQTPTIEEWFAALEQSCASDWAAHRRWWHAFWDRSYIRVDQCGEGPVPLDGYRFTQHSETVSEYWQGLVLDSRENAFNLTQRYALERFAQACASRGEVPAPYNGSIFTMDLPAGTHVFTSKGARASALSADQRDWGDILFMWQNTRHPYWSMLTRGDYDTMTPVFELVRGSMEVCQDRCRQRYQHAGAFMTEAMLWKGASLFGDIPAHLQYHYLSSLEIPAMMCDYYAHTQDRRFVHEVLLPCAEEFLKFYELHYPRRDPHGKMVIEPAGVTETYQPVTNPITEVSGLRYLLTQLTSLGDELIGPERAARWTNLLGQIPEVPRRTIRGIELLAPGQQYTGRLICETPELYAVYPFRQVWLGRADFLANARQSFHVRQLSLDGTSDDQSWETGGWQSAPIWAAHLGLPREAARLVSINFDDRFPNFTYKNADMVAPVPGHPRARFPGFWETKMDYTPDNDHGAVSANALQSLLLQSDASKIYLLPAWPEEWDVAFKLHAARQTTVECVYQNGRVQLLKVRPASRKADIVDLSSLDNRVRTLVSVACADRNYLFDLPPMLDAQVSRRDEERLPTTGPWLARFGESLYGTQAGPFPPAAWGGSVFKGNTVYLHLLDPMTNQVRLPAIPRKLLRSQCLTGGEVGVRQNDGGIVVALKPRHEPGVPDTIIRLDFDGPIAPVALAAPYRGSLTTGTKVTASGFQPGGEPSRAVDADAATGWRPGQAGRQWLELDFGQPRTFARAEIVIDNPGHQRGQARAFEIQIKEPDGKWRICYQANVFGNICGKQFEPVTAQVVRLNIDAPAVRQFDLFP